MTSDDFATSRFPARSRLVPPMRRVSVVAAAVLAASLAVIGLPGPARAGTATPGYDQITGIGQTASAITVPWTQGLLDNANAPIPSANADRTNESSSLWFMYSEFQNLTVNVSQTQDLGHQGITVSWTWTQNGTPVTTAQNGGVKADFLQMMECYGDATAGPTPSQCQYGSTGMLPAGVPNAGIDARTGPLCPAGAVASPPNGVRAADGSPATYGCDPLEANSATDLPPCPAGTTCGPATEFDVPFAPVTDPSNLDYTIGDTTYYSSLTTNEVPEAVVGSAGTGQHQFETLTGVQSPGLGCGLAESDGSARSCWLVIVPRGTYEPNGFQVDPTSGQAGELIETSPLSQSNWAQRIQIHLTYAPVATSCPLGTPELQTFGTQIVQRAMQSWQQALNQAANCASLYGYQPTPETASTQNLEAGGDSGVAFTTIPIGSEAARDGNPPPTNLPPILYAPVAVAALDFGFNINLGSTGSVTTPVKLTPLLLAKALTQSYQQDLPDFFPTYGDEGPVWADNNPINISSDPQFQALNPEVPPDPSGPIAPLLTEGHSALNQQVWQWVDADPTATGWLGGTPDANDNNMVINPDYQSLNLGQQAIDAYPRAYPGDLYYCPPTGPSAAALATASASSAGSSTGTSTTTTLTVTPPMAQVGQTVRLTATEVAADQTNPAGSVQFEDGGTDIGAPVTVNASGVAITTATLPSAGSVALSAVFTPASTSYRPSTVTYSEPVCGQAVVTKDTTDLLPYTDNFDSAASAVITGSDRDLSGGWDLTIQSPQNTPGWWDEGGVEPLGQIFMWAADDTPDLAAYGLVPAQLCNDSGSSCISPSVASVTAALNAATPDSSGLLQVNPADPGPGGYPLTQVIYAAVPTNQSAAALNNAANLIAFAAGTGQTTGNAAGDLPPGYLPLSAGLQAQAMNVVAELRGAASTSPSGGEPVTVAIPSSGAFTLTVGTGTVTLTVSGANATAVLNPITVSDTRNTYPGWSVSGQAANFTGSGTAAGSTISGNQLGWTPTGTALAAGTTLGPTVGPASPGLGTTAAVLAQALAGGGFGTSVLGANLTLVIPTTAEAGPYSGTLTVTAVTALP